MVQLTTFLALSALPALALCAPSHRHQVHHLHRRQDSDLVMTEVPPVAVAGKWVFKNACSGDVTFDILRTFRECGEDVKDVVVKAGASESGDILPCENANPSMKVYKMSDTTKANPFQFEFGFRPSQLTSWYNLSHKDCVSSPEGAGIENCAGNAWSISAKSTNALARNAGQCRTYQCNDAVSCCTENAYCDDIATAAREIGNREPVSGCPGTNGEVVIEMQIC